MSEETSADLVDLMYLLPTGLRHRSLQIENLPVASENLASVRCKEDYVEFQYSLRAEKMSWRDQMEKELCILAGYLRYDRGRIQQVPVLGIQSGFSPQKYAFKGI